MEYVFPTYCHVAPLGPISALLALPFQGSRQTQNRTSRRPSASWVCLRLHLIASCGWNIRSCLRLDPSHGVLAAICSACVSPWPWAETAFLRPATRDHFQSPAPFAHKTYAPSPRYFLSSRLVFCFNHLTVSMYLIHPAAPDLEVESPELATGTCRQCWTMCSGSACGHLIGRLPPPSARLHPPFKRRSLAVPS